MPRRGRSARGYKTCDPFCTDKVRIALYKRPQGPHQGSLVLGKTPLAGLDNECFTRSGRHKKGYRNIPVVLEREFRTERRGIEKLQRLIHGPIRKKQQKKKKRNNSMEHQNKDKKGEDQEPKIMNRKIQSMDNLKRFANESLHAFTQRVNETSNYHMNKEMKKIDEEIQKKKQKRLNKKLRKEQAEIEAKLQQRLEEQRQEREKRKEQREWEEFIREKKEYIPFGATNDAPPVDLHKLGKKLFGHKVKDQSSRNTNNLNVGALSFGQNMENRAKEIRKQGVLKRYALIKRKRLILQLKQLKKENKARARLNRKVWS